VRSPQKQKLVSRLPLALAAVAQIKGIPVEQAAEAVADNTKRLYGI
jgi:Tat protein secretion system quality control protein TatD with DNase activity